MRVHYRFGDNDAATPIRGMGVLGEYSRRNGGDWQKSIKVILREVLPTEESVLIPHTPWSVRGLNPDSSVAEFQSK
jgi:hypothetical protein